MNCEGLLFELMFIFDEFCLTLGYSVLLLFNNWFVTCFLEIGI